MLYLKDGVPGSVDEQLVVNFDFGKVARKEDVEAIQDHGSMFGSQVSSPDRYGWLCNDSLIAYSI